ncbi:glycoside hydrolase family 3 protein [Paenibacillus sp. JCM 10914]|uniref:glycoside hydrolase family 3 protein n=1 Tax=Paenibacillus sp. JCM 10914 TaxID=1236974 RepID=UPI0003CC7D1F|nr:glycoside hydrolase family 3 protein [Paenibacillus sp. JCM 10914]GAE05988.1 beta-glucosidase [Paenibacillus sp. JCM 10914]
MNYQFQNPDLPLEQRVNDLVSQFTLAEKIALMCQYQTAVPRLGVPQYKHGTEGAHGVAWLGEATVFPQNTGLACTWNPELMRSIGSVIADETRVYYQRDKAMNGLTVWAPTVDMERDPRWGRTEEAYGEDPHLTGELAAGLVQGMQGDHPFYLKTVATLKHYYGNNNEVDRGSASVSIDPRNKREYYLKAFETPFRKGGAKSMMTAYNSINGVPCNLNHEVNDIVKDEWGMDGFVVGDAGDVLGTVMDHHYVASYAEAVAGSVRAGIDSITDDQNISFQALRDALDQALLCESDLDRALRNTFRVRFRLGEFDPDDRNPYHHVPESKLCAPDHAELSLQAARESVVLLKNDGLLPLARDPRASTALIGPLANEAYTDWYSGTPPYRITPLQGIQEKLGDAPVQFHTGLDRVRLRCKATGRYVTICAEDHSLRADATDSAQATILERNDWGWGSETLRLISSGKFVTESESKQLQPTADEARGWFVKEAFRFEDTAEGAVTMKSWDGSPVGMDAQGRLLACHEDGPDEGASFILEQVQNGIEAAVAAAAAADKAIVFVGNSPFINGKETIDRPDITLPPSQHALIQAVYEANPNTVVVIVGGYPFAVNWEQEHIPSILFTSHAGQELGHAVADVLYGDYNPAGRLNMTWYKSVDQLPDIMDYDIIKGKRTYQYFDGDVLYPFGHGLSYSSFRYTNLSLSHAQMTQDGSVTVAIDVKNESTIAGDEVVQLYVRAEHSRIPRPLRTLKGFRRIHLAPGSSETVKFELSAQELAYWDVTRDRYCVESGTYLLMIGPSSSQALASMRLQVSGETVPPRSLVQRVQAANYDDYQSVYLDECREGGDSIRLKDEEGWIAFHNVNFNHAPTTFEARVSGDTRGGEIRVTTGSPDGPVVGSCKVLPTGGHQAWTTAQASVTGLQAGTCIVYLTLKGEAQLSWFRME